MERDPVCGMTVVPETAKVSVERAGKRYFFCAEGCAQRFRQDAEKYLAPARASAPTLKASPGVRYTCPMHPEIVQIGPGTCPKCGMALEPVDIVAQEQVDPEYESM